MTEGNESIFSKTQISLEQVQSCLAVSVLAFANKDRITLISVLEMDQVNSYCYISVLIEFVVIRKVIYCFNVTIQVRLNTRWYRYSYIRTLKYKYCGC